MKSFINDGLGWFLEYTCRLMKYYPQLTLDYIMYELPMSLGWAFISWGLENDGWLVFSGIKRTGRGYIGQEVDELEKQYFDKYGKN